MSKPTFADRCTLSEQCLPNAPYRAMLTKLHSEMLLEIERLRTAIEQAEKQEQTFGETNVELGFYSDNASNGQQRKLVGKVEMGQLVGNRPHKSASDPDAQGEVAVIKGFDEYGPMLGWFKHWVNFPVGTKLYTTPPAAPVQEPKFVRMVDGVPCITLAEHKHLIATNQAAAQRQWVGLTEDEMQETGRYSYGEEHMSKKLKLEAGTVWPNEYDWETQFAEVLNGSYEIVYLDAGKVRGLALAYKELIKADEIADAMLKAREK
jgi:hypothetical protein